MKKIIRSVFAVLAGSITIFIAAIGSGYLLGLLIPAAFQNDGQMPGSGILLFMLGYSVLFAALGGYITARLAASAPMAHVIALTALQLIGGLASAMQMAGTVPQWFQILIVMLPVPAILLGGKLYREKPAA
jgi:hypothetical protein